MIDVGLVVDADNGKLQSQVLALVNAHPELQHAFTATSLKVLAALRSELELGVLIVDAEVSSATELSRCLWDHRSRIGAVPVVVVYSKLAESSIKALYNVGVKAHIHADGIEKNLVSAIHGVVNQEAYLDGAGLARLLPAMGATTPTSASLPMQQRYKQLSPREREVFQLLCDGMPATRIAEHLRISEKTVQSHRASFCKKLLIKNNTELIGTAVALGVVDLGRHKEIP